MRSALTFFLLVAAACGGAAYDAPPALAQATQTQRSAAIDTSRRSAIVTAAERASPAVVSVNVVRRARQPVDPFNFFFTPRERTVQGLGSGFIVSMDGLVITNQHVIEGADQIVVTTRDGREYTATLLGEDPLSDIAVLRIEGDDLATAAIGHSDDLAIGEWVVAIGNPYGYSLGNTEPTVTAGVVSGVGRNIVPTRDQSGIYVGMIQTDAAINPGNSGGPLVNAVGEVIGVNSSILSASGASAGLGFAIPIERAMRIAQDLVEFGEVRRAWTGVDVAGSEAMRDWRRQGGLAVTAVTDGSPADRAGLRSGDVLLTASGHTLRTFLDWEAVKLDIAPGDTIAIAFRRAGRQRASELVVAELPSARAEKVDVLGDIQLISLDAAVRQERGIASREGALIYAIGERTSRTTGLREGDVIRQINRHGIKAASDVEAAVAAAIRGGGGVRMYFERGQRIRYTDFRVR